MLPSICERRNHIIQLRLFSALVLLFTSASVYQSGVLIGGTTWEEDMLLAPQVLAASNSTHTTKSSSTSLDSRLLFPSFEDPSSKLPRWMVKYMEWHTQRLNELHDKDKSHWKEQNLLIMRCLEEDRCGGTADRLKSLPLFLAAAARNERLLFLRWTRPFALEEFLVPGPYLNWTVPHLLTPLLENTTSHVVHAGKAMKPLVRSSYQRHIWLVEGAAQMTGGSLVEEIVRDMTDSDAAVAMPDDEIQEPLFFFHDLFLTLFRPSQDLAKVIDRQMIGLDLWPNQFATAHIRAKYPGEPYRETWNLTLLQDSVTNAVRCASSLARSAFLNTTSSSQPSQESMQHHPPIFVASDTLVSLQAAQAYGHEVPYRVLSYLDVPQTEDNVNDPGPVVPIEDPPHLNFAKEEDPSAFFSIFADLFLMSQSRCVSFGAGGFGRFGSLVSFNSTCRGPHSIKGEKVHCE